MKLIGSWKDKYVGFSHNYTAYYIMFCPKDIRMFGYENHIYDGQDMKRLSFWWFAFVSHIDRYNK